MIVLVHRDRVGGVDESNPPARTIHLPDSATVTDLTRAVRERDYLPAIDGGRATWVLEGRHVLGLVTQEYREPWPLVPAQTRLVEVAGSLPAPHFYFRNRGAVSPEEVFREFGGDPVRLPREAWDASAEITWVSALRQLFRQSERH